MTVIAALFDDQAQATQAMDKILRMNIKDLDSRVFEYQGNMDQGRDSFTFPVIPNTSGGTSQSTPLGAVVPGFNAGDRDWFTGMDNVERAFYQEGAREGATLAMVEVDDDHAEHIRQVFRDFGARTYKKD